MSGIQKFTERARPGEQEVQFVLKESQVRQEGSQGRAAELLLPSSKKPLLGIHRLLASSYLVTGQEVHSVEILQVKQS